MKKYFLIATTVLAVGAATVTPSDVNPLGNLFVSTVKADEQTLSANANYYIVLPNDHEEFNNYKGTVEKLVIKKTENTPALYYVQESDRNYIKGLNDEGKNFQEWKGTVEEFKAAIAKLADKKVGDAEKTPAKEEQKPAVQNPAEKKAEEKPVEQKPAEKKAEEKPAKVEEKKEEKRTIPETDLGVSAGFFALLGALGSTVIGKKIKD